MSAAKNNSETGDWIEWRVHILRELERLNDNYVRMNNEISTLKTFRMQALTVFSLVQAGIAAIGYLLHK